MNIHEETLKIARNLIKKDPSLTDWVISKFPELKESEDDSVIKWIINEIRDNMNHEPLSEYKKKAEKAIAWLEKQGEQKNIEGTFINVDEVRENFVKEIYRVLANDTTNDRANDIIYYFDSLPTIYFDTNKPLPPDDLIEESYQQQADDLIDTVDTVTEKSTWSEEDERLCSCLIKDQENALDDVRNDKYGHSEIISDLKEMYRERIDWLKSLKQRMRDGNKQIS